MKALSDQDGAGEVRREAGKKKKWILEKFFRNAIAFVMMFRLVRRLHLACTFRGRGRRLLNERRLRSYVFSQVADDADDDVF